jgi:hypothetical protein
VGAMRLKMVKKFIKVIEQKNQINYELFKRNYYLDILKLRLVKNRVLYFEAIISQLIGRNNSKRMKKYLKFIIHSYLKNLEYFLNCYRQFKIKKLESLLFWGYKGYIFDSLEFKRLVLRKFYITLSGYKNLNQFSLKGKLLDFKKN